MFVLLYIKKLSKIFEKAYGEQLILREITDFIKTKQIIWPLNSFNHIMSIDKTFFVPEVWLFPELARLPCTAMNSTAKKEENTGEKKNHIRGVNWI